MAARVVEGLLGEKHFRLMKKTAIFINTGRGPTVQEAALIKALEDATAKAGEAFRRATEAQLGRALSEPMSKRFPTIGHFIVFIRKTVT